MFKKENLKNGNIEKALLEEEWLRYFNNYLFDRGVITMKEYCKMNERILQRKNRARKIAN